MKINTNYVLNSEIMNHNKTRRGKRGRSHANTLNLLSQVGLLFIFIIYLSKCLIIVYYRVIIVVKYGTTTTTTTTTRTTATDTN